MARTEDFEEPKDIVVDREELNRLTNAYLAGKIKFDAMLVELNIDIKDYLGDENKRKSTLARLSSLSEHSGIPLEKIMVNHLNSFIRTRNRSIHGGSSKPRSKRQRRVRDQRKGHGQEPMIPANSKSPDSERGLQETIRTAIAEWDLQEALERQEDLIEFLGERIRRLEEAQQKASAPRRF